MAWGIQRKYIPSSRFVFKSYVPPHQWIKDYLQGARVGDIINGTSEPYGLLGETGDQEATVSSYTANDVGGMKYGALNTVKTSLEEMGLGKSDIDNLLLNRTIFALLPTAFSSYGISTILKDITCAVENDTAKENLIGNLRSVDIEKLLEYLDDPMSSTVKVKDSSGKSLKVIPILNKYRTSMNGEGNGDNPHMGTINTNADVQVNGLEPDYCFTKKDKVPLELVLAVKQVLESSISLPSKFDEVKESPDARINMAGVLLDIPGEEYIGETEHVGDQIDITLISDMSGSMGSYVRTPKSSSPSGTKLKHSQNAGILAEAINLIAKENPRVTGKIIYTNDSGSFNIPLPYEGDLTQFVRADGGAEHIGEAVELNLDSILQSDVTFCFTDGQISGKAIPKKKLMAKNKEVIGLYVTPDSGNIDVYQSHFDTNSKWFSRMLLKDSVIQLAEAMCSEIIANLR